MGIGDELMAAGEARRQAAGGATRFCMLDKHGQPKWHPVWAGNPNIAEPGQPFDELLPLYFNRKRPYLEATSLQRFEFRAYRPAPAFVKLDERARAIAARTAGAVVFNPAIKPRASPNKDWGLANWKALVGRAVDLRWVEIGETPPRLRGAQSLQTASFMEACGAIAGARAVVVHEGALHHAAAALGVPAIVIRGGFISPRVTGYDGQVDFYVEDRAWPLGCGMRQPCRHCIGAMASITPEAVLAALRRLLAEKKAA